MFSVASLCCSLQRVHNIHAHVTAQLRKCMKLRGSSESFTQVTEIMNILMSETDFGSVWRKSSFRTGIICPKNQTLSSPDGCLIFAKLSMCKVSKRCSVRIWVYELLTFLFLRNLASYE
jgi:hypothetical protein